ARLAVDGAERGIERREHDQAEDREHEQERDEALELLPQRVGVLLLEDALPQLRERHLEAAPPHLDDVRADRERDGADRDVAPRAERDGTEKFHPGTSLRSAFTCLVLISRTHPIGRCAAPARRTECSCAFGRTAARTSCSTPRAPCSTFRARARTPRAATSRR